MPREDGDRVTDHWCSGTEQDVERLMHQARCRIDGEEGEWVNVRMLSCRSSKIKGTELFMGWLQLIRLQSKQDGFQDAYERMMDEALPRRRAMD